MKYIKWREDFGVDYLSNDGEIKEDIASGKTRVLDSTDISGRYISEFSK